MALLWNGDLATRDRSQYGGVEFGGTFDGTPSVGQRVICGQVVDGKQPRHPDGGIMKTLVRPGDQYGSSSGERTLLRQHEPIRSRNGGYDSALALCVMFPDEWTFDSWAIVEWHGSSPYPSLVNLRGISDGLICEVNRGTSSVQRQGYAVLPSLERGVWYDVVLRVKHHQIDGIVEVYVRKAGQTSFSKPVSLTGVPTCLNSNYLLFGFYGPNQSHDRWILHGGAREYSTVQEAVAWLDSLAGTIVEPPPPPPPPPPEPEPDPYAEIREELRLEIQQLRKSMSWAKVKERHVWKAFLLAGGS